jgi:hypothetical protein
MARGMAMENSSIVDVAKDGREKIFVPEEISIFCYFVSLLE